MIPSKIHLRGEVWRIYRERPSRARLLKKGLYGIAHFDTRRIILAHGQSEEELWVTLVHEILHACYHASGDQHLGADLEERIVEAMDTPLAEAIKALIDAQKDK